MSYLLDTNVVSEWVKPRPDANVTRWFAQADEDRIYLSVITFAEISLGIEELGAGARRSVLESWLQNELPARFEGRILGVGLAVAAVWGAITARSKKSGLHLSVMDAFFAATAEIHALTLVTRNTKHFDKLGISLLNPWTEQEPR